MSRKILKRTQDLKGQLSDCVVNYAIKSTTEGKQHRTVKHNSLAVSHWGIEEGLRGGGGGPGGGGGGGAAGGGGERGGGGGGGLGSLLGKGIRIS